MHISSLTFRPLSILLCLLLLTSVTSADEKSDFKEAERDYKQKISSDSPKIRIEAIQRLGETTYDKVDDKTFKHVKKAFTLELSKKDETLVSEDVLNACSKVLSKIKNPKVIKKILQMVTTKSTHWRVRYYITKALPNITHDDIASTLETLLLDSEPRVQIAAFQIMREKKKIAPLSTLKTILLGEYLWEVKLSVLSYMKGAENKENVPILIEALRLVHSDEHRLRREIANLLKSFVGADMGFDPDAWTSAWKDKQAGKDIPSGDQSSVEIIPKFFGVPIVGKRIVYVVDISGSMTVEMDGSKLPPPSIPSNGKPEDDKKVPKNLLQRIQSIKSNNDNRTIKTRIDALKKELINSIYALPTDCFFMIVAFSTKTDAWALELVPATWDNKVLAFDKIEILKADGATNMFGAIQHGLTLSQQSSLKNGGRAIRNTPNSSYVETLNGADTLFLLTDGVPSAGPFTDPSKKYWDTDGMIKELKKITSVRPVVINTIAIGNEGGEIMGWPTMDLKLLKGISDATGGTLKHLKD